MNISLHASPETKRLLSKLGSSSTIVKEAKRKGLTQASMIFTTFSKQLAPVNTGNLRRNIKWEVDDDGNKASVKADTEYAVHQEYGTGIYGKFHRAITPKRAKMLHFTLKNGTEVFARAVKGVEGKLFMTRGLEELKRRTSDISVTIFNHLKKGLL